MADPNSISELERSISELAMLIEHVDSSLAWAHRRHGKKFETAYTGLTSMSPADEGARRAVQEIWYANNPGEALMSWFRRQIH
jgi:hypothetical protein